MKVMTPYMAPDDTLLRSLPMMSKKTYILLKSEVVSLNVVRGRYETLLCEDADDPASHHNNDHLKNKKIKLW